MITMPKLRKQRKDFVKQLMQNDYNYDQIQEKLKEKFGTGMSNTTLQRIKSEMQEITFLKKEIQHLQEEVQLWKNLYFELKDATIKKIRGPNHAQE